MSYYDPDLYPYRRLCERLELDEFVHMSDQQDDTGVTTWDLTLNVDGLGVRAIRTEDANERDRIAEAIFEGLYNAYVRGRES